MRRLVAVLTCVAVCALTTITLAQSRTQRSRTRNGKSGPTATASTIEGLTEPFRTIDLAAAETGLITNIDVEEGQQVTENQVLARLDDAVLQSARAIAEATKDAVGQIKVAEAEYKLRAQRYDKLRALLGEGHATQEEVSLAESERDVAAARLQQAKETRRIKELEYERTLVQIERRLIRAPISGVVTKVHREPFEFVSYADPVVMQVVQLNPLRAVFTVYPQQIKGWTVGEDVEVKLNTSGNARGTVSYISPDLDGESGTLRVKVTIPNEAGRYRSGDKCTLGDRVPQKLGAARPLLLK